MQGVNNINELRNLSLRLIDDIIGEKLKVTGKDSEQAILNHVNKQITNVLNITKLELQYVKDKNGKVKFLEYESK